MTLLTICQNAADEVSVARPSTVVGNSADEAVKLLRYANKVGKRLMKQVPWQALRAEQTFTAIAGAEQTGILPSDFDRFITDTFWDRTNDVLISGPISAVEWQSMTTHISTTGYARKFAHRGGSVFLVPNAAGGESLAFEYVSDLWCESSGGTGQAAWVADTDVGRLDEELITYGVIYEYMLADGAPAGAAKAMYDDYCDTLARNDQPRAGVLKAGDIFRGRRRFGGEPLVDNPLSVL